MVAAHHKHQQRRGLILVALSGMLYGLIGYFGTKLLNYGFTVPGMLFWRFFLAAIWMGLFILLRPRKTMRRRPKFKLLNQSLFFAAITYSGGSAMYFMASDLIGTGVAMVIFFSFPIFVALYALLFSNWRMNRYAFLSLVAVVLGLYLLKGHGNYRLNTHGILFAIGAASLYASYIYGSQDVAKTIDSSWQTFMLCLANAGLFLLVDVTYWHQFMLPPSLLAWGQAIALGVIATALPVQLLLEGLKRVSPVKASILSVLEPVVTLLVGMLLLQEQVTTVQLIGVIIVLCGAIVIQFEKTPEIIEDKLL